MFLLALSPLGAQGVEGPRASGVQDGIAASRRKRWSCRAWPESWPEATAAVTWPEAAELASHSGLCQFFSVHESGVLYVAT